MKLKITDDTNVYMNEKEKKEFLKKECPTCGNIVEPCGMSSGFFGNMYYHFHCHSSYKYNTDTREIEKVEGCDTKWKIKIKPKRDFRKNK